VAGSIEPGAPCHDWIVPFHLGKHKPVAPAKRAAYGLKRRLQVAGLGALTVAIGMYQLSRGFFLVIEHHGMPVYAAALIATGVLLLLLAVIPAAWLERTADWMMANHKRRRFANRRAG